MLAAARGAAVDRPPVWLMRQAGRYLPEYRAIRANTPFLELCADAERAAEVSLQPHERFGVDAIVVFSDILLPLLALGIELDFDPGPVVANPIQNAEDLARLDGDVAGIMAPTCDAIRLIHDATGGEAAVVGFAGAPWTLVAYALESRLSRDTIGITSLSYRDPKLLQILLDRMAEVAAQALVAQIEAGADVLQIFDTWAGMLDPARYAELAGRATRRVLELLPDERTWWTRSPTWDRRSSRWTGVSIWPRRRSASARACRFRATSTRPHSCSRRRRSRARCASSSTRAGRRADTS
jgi:uroporphyrinogen decarboxylase